MESEKRIFIKGDKMSPQVAVRLPVVISSPNIPSDKDSIVRINLNNEFKYIDALKSVNVHFVVQAYADFIQCRVAVLKDRTIIDINIPKRRDFGEHSECFEKYLFSHIMSILNETSSEIDAVREELCFAEY